ncbi:MAG: Ig-like domain-containing protein [Clostridia bacterium]|nr:Ig-like domain-containing protein [Clostridia bacterium]
MSKHQTAKKLTVIRIAALCLGLIMLLGTTAFADSGSVPVQVFFAADGSAPILIAPNPAASSPADAPTPIRSAKDMHLLAEDPEGYFLLAADIDMSELAAEPGGANWTPIAFSGTLAGAGYTIYNLKIDRFGAETAETVDGNAKVYKTLSAGLFSALDGAQITDLTIRGADIDVRGDANCFAGVLAGWMQNTLVDNCTILDSRVTLAAACLPEPGATDNGKPRTSCNAGVGGLAGFGAGNGKGSESRTGNYNQITNCRVDTTLVFADECDSSLKAEQFLGGVLGAGYADITGCSVNIEGWAAIRGYAHNGGMVGMFYVYDGTDTIGLISGCQVSGAVNFYENNRDRRAYCDPYVGEKMTWPKFASLSSTFRNGETRDYSAKMTPEQCDQPKITDTVVPGSCYSPGYTTHTCSVCGNTWNDTFTPKVHQPGDWFIVRYPGNGEDGLRIKECTLCGDVAEQEVLKAVKSLIVDRTELSLNYKDSYRLAVEPDPSDAYWPGLKWTSTDEKVATVYQDGTVTAAGRGECVITCATPDGTVYASTKVTVGYSPLQWIIKIVLFGWIWY